MSCETLYSRFRSSSCASFVLRNSSFSIASFSFFGSSSMFSATSVPHVTLPALACHHNFNNRKIQASCVYQKEGLGTYRARMRPSSTATIVNKTTTSMIHVLQRDSECIKEIRKVLLHVSAVHGYMHWQLRDVSPFTVVTMSTS